MKLIAKAIDVGVQLSQQHDADMGNYRPMHSSEVVGVCSAFNKAAIGLAIFGHHEDSVSIKQNLYHLLLLQSKDCTLQTRVPLTQGHHCICIDAIWCAIHTSVFIKTKVSLHTTLHLYAHFCIQKCVWIHFGVQCTLFFYSDINEIITIYAQAILRRLLRIPFQRQFLLIADEATDISHNEQMCIAIHCMASSYAVHEVAFGLIQFPNTNALTMFNVIKDVLPRCSLPNVNWVRQANNGTVHMSSVHNDVQVLMKKQVDHSLCLLLCSQLEPVCSRCDKLV